MKKVIIMSISILFVLLTNSCMGKDRVNNENVIFEVVNQRNGFGRPFTVYLVYTNSKNEKEMINFARTLKLDGDETYVQFYNDKKVLEKIMMSFSKKEAIGMYVADFKDKETWYDKKELQKSNSKGKIIND